MAAISAVLNYQSPFSSALPELSSPEGFAQPRDLAGF
jgi:hypothetical protein